MFRFVDSFCVFLSELIGSFFRFPTNGFLGDLDSNFDEFNERHSNHHVDQGNREGESSAMVASASKYDILYRKGISGFIEKPKTKSFTVHEFYVDSNAVFEDKTEESALRFSLERNFDFEKQIEVIKQEQPVGDYVGSSFIERTIGKTKQDIKNVVKEKTEESVENYIIEKILEKEVHDIEGNQHVAEKSGDFFESTVIDMFLEKWHQENMEHEIHECNTRISDLEAAIFEGPINASDYEFIEWEQRSVKLSLTGERPSEEDLSIETESMVSPEKTKDPNLQEDEDSEFESEHDDFIERLKMEVKVARTGGLSTILEESESPKKVQELGPLKIDEKYNHKDHIAEIQKVYTSYSDKMRIYDRNLTF